MVRKAWAVRRLFSHAETSAALSAVVDVVLHSPTGALAKFASVRPAICSRERKIHVEIPLRYLQSSCVGHVRPHIPNPVLRIYEGLLDCAMLYTQEALQHGAILQEARASILDDVETKSVLRLLLYDPGVGCRPHTDPGLCTALLLGSSGGLEINDSAAAAQVSYNQGLPGNFQFDSHGTGTEGGNHLDALYYWRPVPIAEGDDTLLLAGGMLQGVSARAIPAVLHRVRPDWGSPSASKERAVSSRSNIAVELRPAAAKRWYNLMRNRGPA